MSIQKETTTYDKPFIEKQIREHQKKFGEIYIKYAGLTPSTPIKEIKFDILNSNTNSRIQSALIQSNISTLKDLLEWHIQTKKTKHIGKKSQKCIEDFILRYYPFLAYSPKDKDFFGRALEEYKISIESDLEEVCVSLINLEKLLNTISIPSYDEIHDNFTDMYGDNMNKCQNFLEEVPHNLQILCRFDAFFFLFLYLL